MTLSYHVLSIFMGGKKFKTTAHDDGLTTDLLNEINWG